MLRHQFENLTNTTRNARRQPRCSTPHGPAQSCGEPAPATPEQFTTLDIHGRGLWQAHLYSTESTYWREKAKTGALANGARDLGFYP